MKRSFTEILLTAAVVAVLARSGLSADGGPLAHWKFDTIDRDRQTTPDASPNARHGRVADQHLAEGIVGRAMRFGGHPAQIVRIGDLKVKAPATVAFWIKTRSLANDRRIFSQLEGDTAQAGAIRLHGQFDVWDGTQWQGVITEKIRHNTWMHVAVVFRNDGRATGYLNGRAGKTVTCRFEFDGVEAAIGAKMLRKHGATFNGLLDDFRIYDRSLSAREITELYQGAARSKGPG